MISKSAFVPGEIIDLTIKGARVEHVTTEGLEAAAARIARIVVYANGGAYYTVVPLEQDTVTVERRAPAEWPPQPGDLWRDRDGLLHFAASYSPDYDDAEDSPDYDDAEDSRGIDDDGCRVVLLSKHSDETCRPGHEMHRPENVHQQCGPLTLVHREDGEPS